MSIRPGHGVLALKANAIGATRARWKLRKIGGEGGLCAGLMATRPPKLLDSGRRRIGRAFFFRSRRKKATKAKCSDLRDEPCRPRHSP